MINAVSPTPQSNNQPLSPMGAGPVPGTPTMPTPNTVVEHPVTPATPMAPMPSAGMPAAPVATTTTTTTTASLPQRPDLRENKTSFNPPTVQTTTTTGPAGAGNGAHQKTKKSMGMVLGIVAFFILLIGGGAGLFLSTRNQDVRQQASTGTTTPGCNSTCQTDLDCPSAHSCSANKCVLSACLASGASCDANKCVITNSSACSLNFVATANNSISCEKLSYQDELTNSAGTYTLSTQKSNFQPGDVVVFKITTKNNGQAAVPISLTDVLADNGSNNLGKVTFMDSDCGANAYNSTTKTLTCPAGTAIAVGASTSHTFRVRLASTIADNTTISNKGTAAVGTTTTAECSVAVSITNVVTYSCNSNCTTDAQCQGVNSNYVCDSANGNKCRLNSNTASSTCSPITVTPSPTPSSSPSPTPTPGVTPSPTTYSCNSDCTTDAQCQAVNASYVCDSTHGNKCRIDSDRNSTTCTPPTGTYACNSTCSTDAQCQSANANYICDSTSSKCRLNSNASAESCQPTIPASPTPAVGCNEVCTTNADCSANNQVCVTTSQGLRCRLDNYVNSESCTTPGTTSVVPTPVAVASTQPTKPTELPRTGSTETTIRFLIMGAGAVVLGALGLLLL